MTDVKLRGPKGFEVLAQDVYDSSPDTSDLGLNTKTVDTTTDDRALHYTTDGTMPSFFVSTGLQGNTIFNTAAFNQGTSGSLMTFQNAYNSVTITEANSGSNFFKVSEDITATLTANDTFTVANAATDPNNGTYAVGTSALDVGDTKLTINSISDATIDGNVSYNGFTVAITDVSVGSNYIKVSGDVTSDIAPNDIIVITGSTGNDGTYTVSSDSFASGETTFNIRSVTGSTLEGDINYRAKVSHGLIVLNEGEATATGPLAVVNSVNAIAVNVGFIQNDVGGTLSGPLFHILNSETGGNADQPCLKLSQSGDAAAVRLDAQTRPTSPSGGDVWIEGATGYFQYYDGAGIESLDTKSREVEFIIASNYALDEDDNAKLFTNETDTDGSSFDLPTAVAGLTYSFYVQTAQTVTINVNTGDTIRNGASVSTTGTGDISSSTVGDCITLTAINATQWVTTSVVGTWTTS